MGWQSHNTSPVLEANYRPTSNAATDVHHLDFYLYLLRHCNQWMLRSLHLITSLFTASSIPPLCSCCTFKFSLFLSLRQNVLVPSRVKYICCLNDTQRTQKVLTVLISDRIIFARALMHDRNYRWIHPGLFFFIILIFLKNKNKTLFEIRLFIKHLEL